MSDGIELNLRVNTETGQLEVLGTKFDNAAGSAKKAEESFLGLSGEAGRLVKELIPLATGMGVLEFFKDAVGAAEANNEAMKRLKFTVEATGQSWAQSGKQIDEWAKAVSSSTRFTETEALQSLDKLARATRSVTEAEQATQLAMGLSVKTGKDLAETTQFVNGLINKNARSIMLAHREYGNFVTNAKTAQEVLDQLGAKFGMAAFNEEGLTKSSHSLNNAFEEFKVVIGNSIIPALTKVLDFGTSLIRQWENLASVVAANVLTMQATFVGLGQAMNRAVHLDFDGAKAALVNIQKEVHNVGIALTEEDEETERKKTASTIKHSTERIHVSLRETASETKEKEKQAQTIAQLNEELDKKIAETGQKTLQKKQNQLALETEVIRKKINTEVNDEKQKQLLLEKLEKEAFLKSQDLIRLDTEAKLKASLDVMSIAAQTLSTINSMGDQHAQAEVNRAKAILAMEKAIAIARAISAAMAAPPGVAQAIAAAQVALVSAQFAQQWESIDQAQAAYKQGQSASSSGTPAAATTAVSGPLSIPGLTTSRSSSPGPLMSSGGGGSAGAGSTTINVGGVSVNVQAMVIDKSNIETLLTQIGEAARSGTIAAVQAAISLNNLAVKNAGAAF